MNQGLVTARNQPAHFDAVVRPLPDFLLPPAFSSIIASASTDMPDMSSDLVRLIQRGEPPAHLELLTDAELVVIARFESGRIAAGAIFEAITDLETGRNGRTYTEVVNDSSMKFERRIDTIAGKNRLKNRSYYSALDEIVAAADLSHCTTINGLATAGVGTALKYSAALHAIAPRMLRANAEITNGDRHAALFNDNSPFQRDIKSWLGQIARLPVDPFSDFEKRLFLLSHFAEFNPDNSLPDAYFAARQLEEATRYALINKEWMSQIRAPNPKRIPWTGCPGLYMGVISKLSDYVRGIFRKNAYTNAIK